MSASVSQMQHGLSVKTDRPCMNKVIWKLTVIAAKGQWPGSLQALDSC